MVAKELERSTQGEENKGRKVALVVEDDNSIRSLLSIILEVDAGYLVVEAVDGIQALEVMENITPDILVMDLNTPRMGGLELARRISADPRNRDIRVAIVTASPQGNEASKAIPGSVFIKKPFDVNELLVAINNLASTVSN